MTQKTKNILGWILTILLAIVFIGSASMKLMGGEAAAQGAEAMGISANALRLIGIVEIISIVLFIVPRTGILGTLLLAAYLGGATATHLLQEQSVFAPLILQSMVWTTAVLRSPELNRRLLGKATA